MGKPPSLSIFFPCYNDARSIQNLLPPTERLAENLTDDYEILVIDDGSDEENRKLLRELASGHPRLLLIFHEKNVGYGGALRSGFLHSTKEWIFYTDGDGQYDVSELENLWSRKKEGVDFINGYKISRKDALHRIVLGNLYRQFVRFFFRTPVRDVDCDFRLIRRSVIERIELRQTGGAICLELVKNAEGAGCRFLEVPVHHHARRHGKSQFFNFPSLVRTGVGVCQLAWKLGKREKGIPHVPP